MLSKAKDECAKMDTVQIRELELLKRFKDDRCDNIVLLVDSIESQFDLHIIMEYLPITLENFLRQSCVQTSNASSRVPFSIAKDVVADLSHAVFFSQTRCILHSDIKPGNVCVKSAGQPLATAPYSLAARPTAILCDFGLARDIAPTQSLPHGSTTNTDYYIRASF